jgi:SRSO17 transposase
MDAKQIRKVGRSLTAYLEEFADCYGRCDTREYLRIYVRGQMSDLQRKSVEPMALRAGVPPRSLQAFLGLLEWDEDRLVDRLQWIVGRDHANVWAIGIIDETSSQKDGHHTACTQRQWCGSLGKVENCVVSVHVGYTVGDFHCVLDSDLFVPESWANDPAKRAEVGMPEDVIHRSKPQIALEQIRRALGNGIRVAAWTFDEHYGQSYKFLDGLDQLGQTYVAEVPCTFCGWAMEPAVLYRSTPEESRRGGRKRRGPRLAKTAAAVSEVRDLLCHSPVFTGQAWTPVHIKNGEKGPIVREAKAARFFMRREGLPTRAHWLIVARDPQRPDEIKFFVSNAAPGSPLEWLLHVAYSRWPIEQCFREEKDELGFDHFEVRKWQSIHRHLYLSQVSHLFLNKMREHLVAEESTSELTEPTDHFPPRHRRRCAAGAPARESDRGADSLCPFPVAPGRTVWPRCRKDRYRGRRGSDPLSPPSQHVCEDSPHQNETAGITQPRYRRRSYSVMLGE